MKEFLSDKKIDFETVDVLNDPAGRARLNKLGLRQGPIIAKGDEYVFGQSMDDVVEFLGLGGSQHQRLPTDQLIGKWRRALQVAEKYARQLPNDERLHRLALEGRPRTVRQVTHHLIRIAEAFLEATVDNVEYTMDLYQKPPLDGTFATGESLAVYAADVDQRLQKWWDELEDRSCSRTIKTYYGKQSIYVVYER
ncbi:MAG: hypothetical protein K8S22_14555, partial [Betaproteobacteria bacterium]|nr:hypothetical protein [Betaproteobacteria bacterium]